MLSAFILTELGYPAMPLAGQLVHQRFILRGPLVLAKSLLKFRTPVADRRPTILLLPNTSSGGAAFLRAATLVFI